MFRHFDSELPLLFMYIYSFRTLYILKKESLGEFISSYKSNFSFNEHLQVHKILLRVRYVQFSDDGEGRSLPFK